MKHHFRKILTASTASVLALTGLSQDATEAQKSRQAIPTDTQSAASRASQLNGAAKASDLIGTTVRNYQDEKLGTVEDLAVDIESGRVVQVILSTGGFIGIGNTLTAVPPGALHHDVSQKVLHLNADKAKLKAAPVFEMTKWVEYSDNDHLSSVYRYYGEEPAFGFVQKGDFLPETTGFQKNARWSKDNLSPKQQAMIPAARLRMIQQASKLMGTPVQNLQDEKLGKVENILVDISSGRLVAIVVSSGGFLGIGDELSAIPPLSLRFAADRSALLLDVSKEGLAAAPHFNSGQWPDFTQSSYVSGIYQAFRVEPYFGTSTTPGADNTARNVRDRKAGPLTPLDQGNSKSDVSTTAQIRKEIVAGDNMSVNAKNVKIITLDGRVTLRGPVNTAEEKRLIGEISDRIARSENVDNQLEVTLTPLPNNKN